MTIYLDYIFIENFLIDYILIKETAYISKRETTLKKTTFAAIISSLYVVVMMYLKIYELNFLICKLLLIIVIIYIAFSPRKISDYIKLSLLFFLVSAINVGVLIVTLNFLNIENAEGITKIIIYVAGFFVSKLFTTHMWKVYKSNITNESLIYDVEVCLGGKQYKYKAFLDTGNNVFSYTNNLPILFAEIIDEDMKEELEHMDFFNITTVTLSNLSNKKAYIFDEIKIIKEDKTWLVKSAIVFETTKLSRNNSYNMLLNYILYTQELGGIKI